MCNLPNISKNGNNIFMFITRKKENFSDVIKCIVAQEFNEFCIKTWSRCGDIIESSYPIEAFDPNVFEKVVAQNKL